MKRVLSLSLVALLVGGLSTIAQEKKDPPAPVPATGDLYPLKKDSTWTYEVAGGEITVKVIGTQNIGGVDCFQLETTANGKVSATEHVKVEKDGVYRHAVNGMKPDAPIKFLILPADDKATWSVDTKVQGQEIKGSFVVKKEDVTVNSTAYKATLVESKDLKIGGMDTTIKQWFAPGVGVVKLEFKLGGQEATLTLKKYEPGK